MILAITGTPATGKTSVAKELSAITGWQLVGLNDLAEKKGLHSGFDEERECRIVDLNAIRKEISEMTSDGRNMIIESHYAHDIPADLVLVLRSNPDEIRKRGKEKGWGHTKTEENVVAEIMEECKIDSIEQGRMTREFDTTGKSPTESAKNVAAIMQEEGMVLSKDVVIPGSLKKELREPYGELFTNLRSAIKYMKDSDIIAVGDFVSYSLYKSGVRPVIFVVDGLVRRKPFKEKIELGYEAMKANNKAGSMTVALWKAVQGALDKGSPVKITVDGEEDMAVLPFTLMAKEGTSIIYGLHRKGACVIRVNEENRKMARNILRKIVASQA